jgi:hypothetical protein
VRGYSIRNRLCLNLVGGTINKSEVSVVKKKQIQVAGHTITQLTETEYEAENKGQNLDFYFDTGHPNAVEVFVFDSLIPTQGDQDPHVTVFYAADLEEAVSKAMALTRRALEESSRYYNVVQRLRDIANRLTAAPDVDSKAILFPGWHEDFEGDHEQLIREAASAILAAGVEPDKGKYVSQKAVAALLHYIADMMELTSSPKRGAVIMRVFP